MNQKEKFPKFDDPKLRALVESLERILSRGPYRARRQSAVTSSTYQVDGLDEVIHIDYTVTGAVSIDLPKASLFKGRALVINDRGETAGSNNITLTPPGAETIDGSGSYVISSNGACVTIASDGENWYIEGTN